MNIPIQNIYYLLCYAWDKLEEDELTHVGTQDTTELVDLFAKVLLSGTTYLFKKGLDRGYVAVEEDSRSIRGKILFGPSIKRQLFQQAKACCEYDELRYNVLHNQILKTTIRQLVQVKGLDREIEKGLVEVYRRFPEIDEIQIQSRQFGQVRLHRNNFYYDFLMKVCEIIHGSLFVDEHTGDQKFRDFVRDDAKMRLLFEEFVRNFYRREQTKFKVRSEDIQWAREQDSDADRYLPRMRTDISLVAKDQSRKIVIDTKYKEALQLHYNTEKVISDNLYQLYAYLKNLESLGGANAKAEGVLLYPTTSKSLNLSFFFPSHTVRVKTINLDQDWRNIHKDLLALVA